MSSFTSYALPLMLSRYISVRRKEALDAWAGKLLKARSMAKSFKVKSMMNAKVLRRVAKQVRVLDEYTPFYEDQ